VANDLFDLFRDQLKIESGLVATDPHTLETISSNEEEQGLILERISNLETTRLKIDYSDFDNFVFFNSALDYFNITGEKILNEYPFDGTCENIERFENDLDQYQQHVVKAWPKSVGHLRIDPTIAKSYVAIEDIGSENGKAKNGLLSPGTGSLTVEMWYEPSVALTGTDDFQMLIQKMSGSSSTERYGYSLFLTGSNITFMVRSGSVADSVSTPFAPSTIQYVAGIFNRSSFTGSIAILTGSQTEFPVIAQSASINIHEALDIPAENLYIGSGTLELPAVTAGLNVWFTGSIDDVKIWNKARTIQEISSSFNVKQFAQKNLNALYRFNTTGSAFENEDNKIALDYSGHGLNGRIQNYHSALRHSGTFLVREDPDLILNLNTSDISEYIAVQQASGSAYDRQNSNKITDMLPENFFKLEELQQGQTDVLKNFVLIAARHYDIIKSNIDQFINVLKVNYSDFDQTPDALLDVVAKFFGWEFTGNFLNTDAFQYLIGRSVLKNVQSNEDLDKKLFEIKNEFWRRTLINLMHLYKTKGTRESVKSLLRAYGVNENFVRLKEYSHQPEVSIQTKRITADKSVYALGFGSGSVLSRVEARFPLGAGSFQGTGSFTLEGRFRFPLTSSTDIQATLTEGFLMSTGDFTAATGMGLWYHKDSVGSHTGTLALSSSDSLSLNIKTDSIGIFNNEWYNVAIIKNQLSSSISIEVRHIDESGDIDLSAVGSSGSVESGQIFVGKWNSITVGGIGSDTHGVGSSLGKTTQSQFWAQEIRYWDRVLTKDELDDHAINFQSYGVNDINENLSDLKIHLRLNGGDESVGTLISDIENLAIPDPLGFLNGLLFASDQQSYKKFLNRYHYIASLDFGWNEDKVRTFNTTTLKRSDFVNDLKIVSLEFNMIDALNEDIVQMLVSLDELNQAIGFPANKYRIHYDDIRILRDNYFKRLQGRLNFTIFADMLEFFDRTFIEMVKKLIPARAYFIGDEFVVESHMLERPKVTYERRKNQETQFVPEGRIEVWTRFGRNKDKSGKKFPLLIGGGS